MWKENGITKYYEYGIITNEIYKEWSGMKASEYKDYKNIRKKSLRDNMTDMEIALTDLGEVATRELTKQHKPYELKENKKYAQMLQENNVCDIWIYIFLLFFSIFF